MTELLPELERIPVEGVFDGELVSLDRHGHPSFERVSRRMLTRDGSVSVSLVVFDLLELDGEDRMRLPYRRRRELLEALDFAIVCEVCPRFDDGDALWQTVVEYRLEASSRRSSSSPTDPASGRGSRRKTRTGRATRSSARPSSAPNPDESHRSPNCGSRVCSTRSSASAALRNSVTRRSVACRRLGSRTVRVGRCVS
jgi:hypothetical protein